ncbi:hypothetical protein [Planctomicrobium sp. SH664]|uniref:hypothetical protein n=1 Tax=Planctomicrobium sp. SH664 TaxID=3448125 RepID=UPI003F5C89AB
MTVHKRRLLLQPIMRLAGGMLAVIVCLCCAATVSAQSTPQIVISPRYESPRSQAPLQLDVFVRWNDQKVLEGRVRLDFYVDQTKVYTWVSRDVALSASEVTLSAMTPEVLLESDASILNVKAFFEGEKQTYEIPDEINVQYWTDSKRILTLGVVIPDRSSVSSADFETEQSDRMAWATRLTLDEFMPDRTQHSSQLSSRVMRFDPSRMPSLSLELVAFDLLIIPSDGLQGLLPPQLNAIAEWCEAGGAVCAVGTRAVSPASQEFLKRLLGSRPEAPLVRFEKDGKIVPLTEQPLPWKLTSPGVGRALVTFGVVNLSDSRWQIDFLRLWRLRHHQIDSVMTTKTWKFPGLTAEEAYREAYRQHRTYGYNPYQPTGMPAVSAFPLAPEPNRELAQVNSWLIPEKIDALPLKTVVILLSACLLAIGPVDYFLLGWLKRRRWTWVIFPSVALAFSFLAILLARAHLTSTDIRRELVLADVAADGRCVRATHCEQLFSASQKIMTDEMKNAFVLLYDDRQDYDLGRNIPSTTGAVVPLYVGQSPRSYQWQRLCRQWSAQNSRRTTMGESTELPVLPIAWDRLHSLTTATEAERAQGLREICNQVPNSAALLCTATHAVKALGQSTADDPEVEERNARLISILEKVLEISQERTRGLFGIVSQISPNCAGSFEDLALQDATDPGQMLYLHAVEDEDGNCIVYRRLIRTDEL